MSDRRSHALCLIVRGRVQGVGFRDYAEKRARSLGLTGYVRNLSDGRSVEVLAEGPRHDLEEFGGQLRKGPASAHVTAVETDWREPTAAHHDFRTAY